MDDDYIEVVRIGSHPLTGEFRGCMECHVESDFLLIWVDDDYIEVVRIGSHSELFR